MTLPLVRAQSLATRIAAELAPLSKQVEIVGEIRRRCSRVEKLCLLVECPEDAIDRLSERIFRHAKSNSQIQGPPIFYALLANGLPIEISLVRSKNWGSALIYRTGPPQFVKQLDIALSRNRYSWDHASGIYHKQKLIGGADEQTFFKLLGIPFIPPWERDSYRLIESVSSLLNQPRNPFAYKVRRTNNSLMCNRC